MISPQAKRMVQGATRSWTIWFAMALAVLGAVQMQMEHFEVFLSPKAFGAFNILTGVLIAVLRIVTTTSLEEKAGGQPSDSI